MLTKIDATGKKIKEFSLRIDLYTKRVRSGLVAEMYTRDIDNVNQEKKFYFNGFETTESEFNEVFGSENPLINAKKTLSKI